MASQQPYRGYVSPPPISRPPTDLRIDVSKLDSVVFSAVERVANKLIIDDKSTKEITAAYVLKAMKGTHLSMRSILKMEVEKNLGGSPDLFHLARLQIERALALMLIKHEPLKYASVYDKNAWKAHAIRFFRYQFELSLIPSIPGHYDAQHEKGLREFASQLGVSNDEYETTRAQILGGTIPSGVKPCEIPELPKPSQVKSCLSSASYASVAGRLYGEYYWLCHYSHGGLDGVMRASQFRGELKGVKRPTENDFHFQDLIQSTLFTSYVAMLVCATIFAMKYMNDSDVVAVLTEAWSPNIADGHYLGVWVWDNWAKNALGALA